MVTRSVMKIVNSTAIAARVPIRSLLKGQLYLEQYVIAEN